MNFFRTLPLRTILIAAVVILCVVALLSVRSACTAADMARTEGRVADSQANVGADAAKTTADQVQTEADNAAQTARNREDISRAENANETAGDAGDRGLRSLCGRVQYRDSERCAKLLRSDRANPSR